MTLAEKLKEKEAEKSKGFETIFWKPKEGDVLEGIVQKRGTTITQYGERDFIEVITDEGKTYTIFCNKVLIEQAEGVGKGERIAIKYLGEVQSAKAGKKKYKDYILVSDKPNADTEPAEAEAV